MKSSFEEIKKLTLPRFLLDWHSKEGKLIQDGNHLTYYNSSSNIYVRDGDLESATSPHFLDIGLFGQCHNKCHDCYMKNRRSDKKVMSETDLTEIFKMYKKNLAQVSFGGAGDPLSAILEREYEDPLFFMYLMDALRSNGISINTTLHATKDVTQEQIVGSIIPFCSGVGISVDKYSADANKICEIVKWVNESKRYFGRPDDDEFPHKKIVLHFVIGEHPSVWKDAVKILMKSETYIHGILLLGNKMASKNDKHYQSIFYNKEDQKSFWDMLSHFHALMPEMEIGMDSCLAKYAPPEIAEQLGVYAMEPCDAGRFSAYIHTDGEMNLCSCDPYIKGESWKDIVGIPRSCPHIHAGKDVIEYQHPTRPIVIKTGPMTNSSSSSYFIILGDKAIPKLPVYSLELRNRRSAKMNWYFENKMLIEIDTGEWASLCASNIVYSSSRTMYPAENNNPLELKKSLDAITRAVFIDRSSKMYYLVADRDDAYDPEDGDCPKSYKSHYNEKDIADNDVLILGRGEEH